METPDSLQYQTRLTSIPNFCTSGPPDVRGWCLMAEKVRTPRGWIISTPLHKRISQTSSERPCSSVAVLCHICHAIRANAHLLLYYAIYFTSYGQIFVFGDWGALTGLDLTTWLGILTLESNREGFCDAQSNYIQSCLELRCQDLHFISGRHLVSWRSCNLCGRLVSFPQKCPWPLRAGPTGAPNCDIFVWQVNIQSLKKDTKNAILRYSSNEQNNVHRSGMPVAWTNT